MWEDIVVPDLQHHFSSQIEHVLKVIREAKKRAPDHEKGESAVEIHIPREDGELWYGALNQARIALESHYKFGPIDEIDVLETLSPKKRDAFLRERFYMSLQSVLIQYVMGY